MLSFKQIKRYLALASAEVEYDRKHSGVEYPEGFKAAFERQTHFQGWINYRVTWYIDENNDPWKIIPLKRPLVEEWHEELIKVVPVITEKGEIVSAEEWEKRSASTN